MVGILTLCGQFMAMFDSILKFLDCKLTRIVVFPKSLDSERHMLLMLPLTEVFWENICKKFTIKWKSANKTIALSTGQKFIHFRIKINVLKEQCKSNALLVEKTNHSSKLHATSVLSQKTGKGGQNLILLSYYLSP